MVKNTFLRTSYMEVLVDDERNLSSTEKSVFHLGLLLLQADFLLEVWVHDDLIFAWSISQFGNLSPPIDCDVSRSSKDSTISTSLINSIASVGKLEQDTSVLKLVFQHWNVEGLGNLSNMHFRDLIPRLFNHTNVRISSLCMRGRMENSLADRGVGIAKFCLLLSNSSPLAADLPLFRDTGSQCVYLEDFLHFQSKLLSVHTRSVYHAASRTRG